MASLSTTHMKFTVTLNYIDLRESILLKTAFLHQKCLNYSLPKHNKRKAQNKAFTTFSQNNEEQISFLRIQKQSTG